MDIDVGQKDSTVRDILAIAIIKKQKELEKQLESWKQRAERAEREVECLRSALTEFNPASSSDIDSLTRLLPDLPRILPPPTSNNVGDVLEDIHRHRDSIAVFLRNIHALRTAQLLKSKEECEMWTVSTTKLVSDFASTSLLELVPGKLRTAYISHVVKFFHFRSQDLRSSPENFLDEIQGLVEHIVQSVVEKSARREGDRDSSKHGGLEVLWSLMDLPVAQSCILKSSTESIFTLVRSQAQHAHQLHQQHHSNNSLTSSVEPAVVDLVRELCLLQEKSLERILGSVYSPKGMLYLPNEVLEEVVKTSMHAQQFVEILEIVCPELASLLYLSTSLVIAFLHRLSNQKEYNSSVEINFKQTQQQKCSQLSRNIRDFYMPKTWDLNINEP